MSVVVPPEARRWLDAPVPPGARVTVAGVAGGVGTTTVTGLLWWALTTYGHRRVALLDHGGGSLAARLPSAPPVPAADLELHDAGSLVGAAAHLPGACVLVCGAHAAGLTAAATAVRDGGAHGRCVVVPVAVTGTALPGAALLATARRLGLDAPLVPLHRSRALAAGGDVPGPETARSLADAHRAGVAVAAETMRVLVSMGTSPHAKHG
ncbi:hypothetical protein AA0Y32_03660 [Georgenia phoenicis]|uniref:hypothetical protein n=1 Tax=unclassified Georgenia TaxID=2626815 RepID=UPI0039AF0FEA